MAEPAGWDFKSILWVMLEGEGPSLIDLPRLCVDSGVDEETATSILEVLKHHRLIDTHTDERTGTLYYFLTEYGKTLACQAMKDRPISAGKPAEPRNHAGR